MTTLNYDKILSTTVDGEKIRYGILWGNEKIVFIKAGVPKDAENEDEKKTKDEYIDKYLIMAHRIRDRIGATVICASNGDAAPRDQLRADKFLIKKVIAECGSENHEMYFVGNSDGGEHSLKLAQQFPETVTFLGINSSWSNMETFLERIQSIPHARKIFVYGKKDSDFHDIAPKLKALACDNLEIVVLDGVDHHFTDKINDFIALADLL